MNAAGFLLTGMRRCRRRAHAPMILAHSLTSDFSGIEERESYFPDFESFHVWPATARLLWQLRGLDRLAGQSSVAHFGHWQDPARRKFILCTRKEAKRARWKAKFSIEIIHMFTPSHVNKRNEAKCAQWRAKVQC